MMTKDGEEIQLGIPEQMRAMAAMIIRIGRLASPEEAAGPVFFLCSPWSDYVHGQVLNVTGGQFAGWPLMTAGARAPGPRRHLAGLWMGAISERWSPRPRRRAGLVRFHE